jgi:hypothetical protein
MPQPGLTETVDRIRNALGCSKDMAMVYAISDDAPVFIAKEECLTGIMHVR